MNLKLILTGIMIAIANFTSVAVVTSIMGLNIPVAFVVAGISTLITHSLTKHALPTFIGISGLFIGGVLTIKNTQGIEYALGGVIMAGIVYIILSVVFYLFRDKVQKYLPDYIIGMSLMLIGLSLLPIGSGLISQSMSTGLIAVLIMLLIEFKFSGITKILSMPIALIIATIFHGIAYGLKPTITSELTFSLQSVSFSIEAFLTISIIALATLFEVISDMRYSAEISGVDLFKDVGVHRTLLSVGIGSIIAGLFGAGVVTSYGENNSSNKILNNKDSMAQKIASIIFIILGLLAFPLTIISYIPQSAFGGVLLVLFSSISISGMKIVFNSDLNLNKHHSRFLVLAIMLGISTLTFIFNGVSISAVSIAIVVGIILNAILDNNNGIFIGERGE